ncbi:hypothetical protein [Xenorhabdus bovienii]|uniref:Uncharacterized protein n=1 Tax=Xenorhabdus bovienii str. kraussei Becker Underwood TaxID=1398204 RepID=A0A077PV68_XENBV|nr:hypothetical protein [Xenorhabdus bovienii]CDH24567.1 exported hypothetical protein [Xenorhabdus bovienii str. kraussei Becker Underwood]
MKWRVMTGLAFLLVLSVVSFGVYASMNDLIVGILTENDRFRVIAQGFAVVIHFWPVALAGAVLGGVLTLMVSSPAFSTVQNVDHENQRRYYRQQAEAAESRAESAEKVAHQRLQTQLQAAESREREATYALDCARQLQQDVAAKVRNIVAETERQRGAATQEVEQSHTKAQDAERRRRNAAATAERLRRKQERQDREGQNRNL